MVIYRVTNLINGKIYIGKTVQTLAKRKRLHLRDTKEGSKLIFHKAIRKYGEENFKWEIINELSKEYDNHFLNKLEKYKIAMYKYVYHKELYNMTDGGEGIPGFHLSEETRLKLSELAKNRVVSLETCKKISENHTKEKNPFWGKKLTEEHKQKLIQTNTGSKRSEETKLKMSIASQKREALREEQYYEDRLKRNELLLEEINKKLAKTDEVCI